MMPYLNMPALASVLWIGGGSLALLFVVVFLIPLLRRKAVRRYTEDDIETEDFTQPRD